MNVPGQRHGLIERWVVVVVIADQVGPVIELVLVDELLVEEINGTTGQVLLVRPLDQHGRLRGPLRRLVIVERVHLFVQELHALVGGRSMDRTVVELLLLLLAVSAEQLG